MIYFVVMPARFRLNRAEYNQAITITLLIYRHCFVTLSTEVRKWPPKTGRRKSPSSENWPSFGRLDGLLAKSLLQTHLFILVIVYSFC